MRTDRKKHAGPEQHRGAHDVARGDRNPALQWYPWYPGAHLRLTHRWPLTARGAYRELLDVQWAVGELPVSPARLRDLVGVPPADWRVVWRYCEPHFPHVGSGRRNPDLEEHRAEALERSARRRRAGLAGSRVRWGGRATVIPIRPEGDDAQD